jgi:hypothetical protein
MMVAAEGSNQDSFPAPLRSCYADGTIARKLQYNLFISSQCERRPHAKRGRYFPILNHEGPN